MIHYRVVWDAVSRWIQEQSSLLLQRHDVTGFRRLARDLTYLDQQLRIDPTGFGEPKYRLRQLQLIVCIAIGECVKIKYGVHETEPLVFVSELAWLNQTA